MDGWWQLERVVNETAVSARMAAAAAAGDGRRAAAVLLIVCPLNSLTVPTPGAHQSLRPPTAPALALPSPSPSAGPPPRLTP